MKSEEVTLRSSQQFTNFPRFSLTPANSDQVTLPAANRRVASSNLARGAKFLSINELAAALFRSLATVVKRSTRLGMLNKRTDTNRAKTQRFLRKRLSKARPLRLVTECSGIFSI